MNISLVLTANHYNTKDTIVKLLNTCNRNFLLVLSSLDSVTLCHSVNCMVLTMNYYDIYREELKNISLEEVALGALLHDIGKLPILDLISSDKKFTKRDRLVMQSHPSYGYNLARELGIENKVVLGMIHNHHMRANGTGYPYFNVEVPPTETDFLLGMIDSFEAMTSTQRSYKEPFTRDEALKNIAQDVDQYKYSDGMYERFVSSLCDELVYIPVPLLQEISTF